MVFFLGTKAISWSSRKQKIVALSSEEADYVLASDAACEAIWLRRILHNVEQVEKGPTTIFYDNISTIAMTKNPIFHSRTKHIELRHHFIRDLVQDGEVFLKFINTNEQVADIFTKSVSTEKFTKFKGNLGITN